MKRTRGRCGKNAAVLLVVNRARRIRHFPDAVSVQSKLPPYLTGEITSTGKVVSALYQLA